MSRWDFQEFLELQEEKVHDKNFLCKEQGRMYMKSEVSLHFVLSISQVNNKIDTWKG